MFGKTPQRVRPWFPKHGVQSDVLENKDGTYLIRAVRDFTYTQNGVKSEKWISDVSVTPARIRRAWYLLEPFTDWEAIAHPYFIFEYDDGRTQCFTIEGKRLDGQPYSGFKGLLNEYELGYLWITEKDCLTMPLAAGAKALYLYPLTLTPSDAATLCTEFLRDTHTLFQTPEFYNTLFNNCTIRFARTLRRNGHHMPHDVSWYLPGYSDHYLARLGLIPHTSPLRSSTHDLVVRKDEVWRIIESSTDKYFEKIFASVGATK